MAIREPSPPPNHQALARALGLSGSWLEVGQGGLLSPGVFLRGCYFLVWGDNALLWWERDGVARSIFAYYRDPEDEQWQSYCQAGGPHLGRPAVLKLYSFDEWDAHFSLMELVATPAPNLKKVKS